MKKRFGLFILTLMLAAFFCLPALAEDVSVNTAESDETVVLYNISAQLLNPVLYDFTVKYDTNNDNVLTQSEADKVTSMAFLSSDLTDASFTYVVRDEVSCPFNELFRNLTNLILDDNSLTSLDTRKNPCLVFLSVQRNYTLSSLTMASDLSTLEYLNVSSNVLETLDLDTATSLTYLDCSKNRIKALDIYHCSSLLYSGYDGTHYFAAGQQENFNFTPSMIWVRAHYLQYLTYDESAFKDWEQNSLVYMMHYPFVTLSPSDCLVGENFKANFLVSAVTPEGQELSYQWQVSTNGGVSWKNCTAATNDTNSYSFKAKTEYSGRMYRCLISNFSGSVYTNTATLTVVPEPTVTASPVDLTVNENEYAVFVAAADGHGEELFYQWQVKEGTRPWRNCTAKGYNTPVYAFKAKHDYDGRVYRCLIMNNYGHEINAGAAVLRVIPHIEILSDPVDCFTYGAGQTASFNVSVDATMPLTYQWQVSKNDGASWSNCTAKGYNTPCYQFKAKPEYADRMYRCVISDGYTTLISKAVYLRVNPAIPTIISQSGNKTVTAGKKVTFTVSVEDTGDNVIYIWQVKKSSTSDWVECTASGCNTNTYSFTTKASYNGRRYRCMIYNSNYTAYVLSEPVKLTVR